MRLLSVLDQKREQGQSFTKDDLIFLYEINAPIEGFGYEKDPRVAELRGERDHEADMPIVFECAKEQIARSVDEIDEYTMAYVGKLEPGIFDKLPEHVEHIYTSFPEYRIRREHIEIGGKDMEELLKLLKDGGFHTHTALRFMMEGKDFTTLKSPEEAKLIRLHVADLGFERGATTQQIFDKAAELGLELCPAEVGPQYRLQYKDQPMPEAVLIGMKQILGWGGRSLQIFNVRHSIEGLELCGIFAPPGTMWPSRAEFMFRLPKKT